MAGSNADFPSDEFRDSIRFAMTMGQPEKVSERVTFRWAPVRTYARPDPGADPYDWTATPTSEVDHADVQVDEVAVQYGDRTAGDETSVGPFDTTRATLTVLDEDYTQVEGANQVLLGGNTYEIKYVIPIGIFDVTVYQIFTQALDES